MIKIKKREINKDAEKSCEIRFYRYLVLILIILFSCIFTFSNLVSRGETKNLIWESVRQDYNDFFKYEIENSNKSLYEIYNFYSNEENIDVCKLMALNSIYFGKDENRYLEPYVRPYIDEYDLKQEERIKLYKEVNKDIKSIERRYTCKLSFKRFLPYILSLVFLIVLMYISSSISKKEKGKKRIMSLLVFFIGGLICLFSILNLKEGIWISLAISLALIEFTLENRIKPIKYVLGAFILICMILTIFKFQYDKDNLGGYDTGNIFLENNFKDTNLPDREQDIQRTGQVLYSEIKNEKLILVADSEKELESLKNNERKIVFFNKESNSPMFYLCLYDGLPVYRVVLIKDGNPNKAYEGILNPYMKRTLMTLENFSKPNNLENLKN